MSNDWGPQACARDIARHLALASQRFAGGDRLASHGAKYFSQGDEDGILHEIFRRVGEGRRAFVELGAGDGLENNTCHLLLSGWHGAWIDADADSVDRARAKFSAFVAAGRLGLDCAALDPGNVDACVARLGTTGDIDLLSVDVDGNDVHLLEALACVRPRVVVAEYNARFGPHVYWRMPRDDAHRWDGTDHFGASLASLAESLARRDLHLVGCNLVGSNAFFVSGREDLSGFRAPFTPQEHYEPARYHLLPWPAGHAPDDRADRPFPLPPERPAP